MFEDICEFLGLLPITGLTDDARVGKLRDAKSVGEFLRADVKQGGPAFEFGHERGLLMNRFVAVILLAFVATQTQAQANSLAFVQIPTLDELGLIGIALVVAIAGGIAARRRRK
jgi:hypothetical protein